MLLGAASPVPPGSRFLLLNGQHIGQVAIDTFAYLEAFPLPLPPLPGCCGFCRIGRTEVFPSCAKPLVVLGGVPLLLFISEPPLTTGGLAGGWLACRAGCW